VVPSAPLDRDLVEELRAAPVALPRASARGSVEIRLKGATPYWSFCAPSAAP